MGESSVGSPIISSLLHPTPLSVSSDVDDVVVGLHELADCKLFGVTTTPELGSLPVDPPSFSFLSPEGKI